MVRVACHYVLHLVVELEFVLYLWSLSRVYGHAVGIFFLVSIATQLLFFFFFSSRRRHTRLQGDWSSDVCSSDLADRGDPDAGEARRRHHARRHRGDGWIRRHDADRLRALRRVAEEDREVVLRSEDRKSVV